MPALPKARNILAIALLAAITRASNAADPQPYEVTLTPTGDAALDQALHDSATLIALRESAPVGPFALVGRAQADAARLRQALSSFGYYDGTVTITIAGHALDDPNLIPALDDTPSGTSVPVLATARLGEIFHIRRLAALSAQPLPADVLASLAPLAPGAPARAVDVLAAQGRMLSQLRADGFALARIAEPEVIEDPPARVLDVTWQVTPGPRLDLGPIRVEGRDRVHESYLRRRLTLHQGEAYSPAAIEQARNDLVSTGVFATVRLVLADLPDAQGQLPVTVQVTEAKRHVAAFNAAYSTDLGGSLGASWTDKNLFGAAEQLTLSAALTQLGGDATSQPGYQFAIRLLLPDVPARDRSVQFDLAAFKENLTAYDRTGESAGVTYARKLSAHWTATAGLGLVREAVAQEGATRDYTLLSLPLSARLDTTDSPLQPTHGARLSLSATPTESLGGRDATFLLLRATGATYFDFGTKGASVLALRAGVGSVQGATRFDLPPDQRFYSGGSATVRGYKYQNLGPRFADNNPQGGAALDAATIEWRQHIAGDFGAAVFLDAGQISTGSAPFTGQLHLGTGIGARYYTAIGPIRLDVAVPVNPEPHGDRLELYIGLGEAF